ncbi:MAG: alpha/beta fold hydrolase [Sphingopyxis sp.]|uniref:alpha/beta fold hydrolase n=1 Tax=Sphingopyxis sp. TaxID=1908224 RepID=UPI002ABD0313|nr:alpha/beta fold hydrolase [Sphingopyxis sp.]MDZ3832665.1 alpha/beta fold hydrolase [Sphingopyxis sp.]
MERRWRAADGISLYARDYSADAGDARLPVICIHGLTRNSRDFEEVAPMIAAQGRRVLAVDVRGRGRSQRSPDPMQYRPPVYARDMLAMMDDLGIARAHFLGTSMGGLITMMVAMFRSRAVAGAILNDIGPEIAKEGLARIAGYAGDVPVIRDWDDAAAYLKRVSAAAFPDLSDTEWRSLAERGFVVDEAEAIVADYDAAIAAPIKAKPPKPRSLLAWLLFLNLARRRPVLLLRGALSDILSAETAAKMQRRAPRMRFTEVPGVGHAPLLNEVAAVDAIAEFLAAHE